MTEADHVFLNLVQCLTTLCYSTGEQTDSVQGLEPPSSVTKAHHGKCLPARLTSLADCTLGQEPNLVPLSIITGTGKVLNRYLLNEQMNE